MSKNGRGRFQHFWGPVQADEGDESVAEAEANGEDENAAGHVKILKGFFDVSTRRAA